MAGGAREQLGFDLGRDDFAEKLALEVAIILLPTFDRSLPQDRCREVALRVAHLTSRRAREAGLLAPHPKTVPCRGCDAPVEVAGGVAILCAGCASGIRSPGSGD